MATRVALFTSTIIALPLLVLISGCGGGGNPFGVKSELVTKADHAAAMAFAPDGRLFYGEQLTGNIRVVTADGELLDEPFAKVDVAVYLEWGLTGLAVAPKSEETHCVYPSLPKPVETDPPIGRPVLVRFTDR